MSSHPWEVDPADLRDDLASEDPPLLVDCREAGELAVASLEMAMHVPMAEIRSRLPELEEHIDRPVVVMCHHGVRSQQAAQHFLEQGFTQVYNLTGGIDAWSRQVDSSVPLY